MWVCVLLVFGGSRFIGFVKSVLLNTHDTHNLQKVSCSAWFSVERTTETESVELFQYVCLGADLIKSVQINQI